MLSSRGVALRFFGREGKGEEKEGGGGEVAECSFLRKGENYYVRWPSEVR